MCAAGALGIAAWFILAKSTPEIGLTAVAVVVMTTCSAGALLLTQGSFRWATALTGSRIGTIGIFKLRTMARHDVAGFRENPTQYGLRSVKLFSKAVGAKSLVVALYRPDAQMIDWFDGLPDLDGIERAASEKSLLGRSDLGATVGERQARLQNFRKLARAADLGGWAVMLWAFFAPRPYELVIACLVSAPVAGAALILWSRGVITIDSDKTSAQPGLPGLFVGAPIVLALRAFLDFNLVDLQSAMTIAGAFGLMAAVAVTGTKRGRWWTTLLVGLFVGFIPAAFGWAAFVEGNVLFDRSQPREFRPQILGKTIDRDSSHTSYNLKLAPWGPYALAANVDASRDVFNATEVGASACISLYAGAFEARWFSVKAC